MSPILFSLALFAAGIQEELLDGFFYADEAAARAAWVAAESTPPVETGDDEGRPILRMRAPFLSRPNLQRVVVDREVSLDLTARGHFDLEIAVDPPEACGHLTLYFRSGAGWYGCSGGVSRGGWQSVRFSKGGFRAEGTPAGWNRIDGIRIACWRGGSQDATVRLRRLAARWSDVAIVIPSAASSPNDREIDSALGVAETVASMLEELGVEADTVDDQALVDGALERRSLALVAYHPRLPANAVEALVDFVASGGKVFACYSLPNRLAAALGFAPGEYVKPAAGTLARIRMADSGIEGMPSEVRQASWNIATAKPDSHGARVVGTWYDSAGNSTGLPALLLSDRGGYFTHIILGDDRTAKCRMLAAILGHLDPKLWRRMAEAELDQSGRIGHCVSLEEVVSFIRDSGRPEVVRRADSAAEALFRVRQLVEQGSFADAVQAAREARDELARAYLLAQESPEVEGRAWWNHSGTGAWPGDWERTARELADAHFNMILPNMLWAGRAHYPSDVLPRSDTFREHGDQIAQCLEAAKRHGLEVHVWKVNFNLSGAPREFVEKLRAEGRLQVFVGGQSQNWLCPSHPANFQLERDSMLEVARKYDVDGLHFDYIRYPGSQSCYCEGCRERFQTDAGIRCKNWPDDCRNGIHKEAYNRWRCGRISRLVEAVHKESKRLRPGLKISAAVFGSYPACRESVAQDWPEWIKAGWLDFVCPMDYTESDASFRGLVASQLRLIDGRIPVYPGIGATASRCTLSADRVAGQAYHARRLGAAGFTIFNLSESTARELLPGLSLGTTATPARPPHAEPRGAE